MMNQPPWLAEAWQHLSVSEHPGARHNETILAFFRDAGHPNVTRDEVPWCAAFVGACLERTGSRSSRSLLARSYLSWGHRIQEPRFGAIAVLSRGADPALGHVGFYIGETKDTLLLLGGNQSDRVSVAAYARDRLLEYRWPVLAGADVAVAGPAPARGGPEVFDAALAHVLEMEGGYTNDPYDPGGPTNKGVTLAVYRRFLGERGKALSDNELIDRLRAISASEVREIYATRYWSPSRATEMSPGIALMHFDASVNHGLRGGAELLQRAAGVTVDGKIGPITMGAVQAASPLELLERYAGHRRQRYRALPHFWRFGRGWLNRVDKTLQRARAFQQTWAVPSAADPNPSEKGKDMIPTDATKPWGQSLTIWGALITAVSTVVPVLGPAIGLDLTPDLVRQAGEQVVTIVQAVGGLVGTLMTIYGRARANQVLSPKVVG
jgi:uncharacterized protein (TIGR02594 family)